MPPPPRPGERRTTRTLAEVEERWNDAWREAGAYVRHPEPGREKFFATYPYSYMNGFPHLGHAFTMMRNEVRVRYERMKGKNALFPMGFHVTGTPIEAAANRIRDGEPTQRRILLESGIPEGEVAAFADPAHWVEYFPLEWRRDLDALGLGIDWSREFHTTDLNPHYDAFIRWQFRRLHQKGLVATGRHPVVWCPKDEAPVADHDRVEGEGETPQEFTLIKLRLLDVPSELERELPVEARGWPVVLVAATLRPETMYGQTNVWIHPEHRYAQVLVGSERWIVGASASPKLGFQFEDARDVTPQGGLPGHLLVGRAVRAPAADRIVPVLPAWFVRDDKGTGVVTSVPSDAPFDFAALRDLQTDPSRLASLPIEEARRREAATSATSIDLAAEVAVGRLPLIHSEGYGPTPAREAAEKAGVRTQMDRAALEAATEETYKAGFYTGRMGQVAGPFAGLPVAEAKTKIQQHLLSRGEAALFYEPTGKVVCRCLTPSTVKIVSDQWFLQYGNPDWKAKTHAAIDRMEFHPELLRKQFHYVVDWLRAWACARESGLGTRLPWDDRWIVESLSDSTIYMAYYALAPHLERGTVTGAAGDRKGVDPADLADPFFDYVLLGKGSPTAAARGTVTEAVVEACRREFLYWYPVDFRNSGKDLIQNHLSFFIFNHVAIWEDQPEMWPRAIAANGWVLLNGQKMSKSSGNFMTLREGLSRFGATGLRLALVNAGEGVDDANVELDFAEMAGRRMEGWLEFAGGAKGGRADTLPVDRWFRSVLHRQVQAARQAMEEANFRSALKVGFFDLQREWAWYVRRAGETSAAVLAEFVDVQTRLLTPFAPHVAEEIHRLRGGQGWAIDAPYPTSDAAAVDAAAEAQEAFVKGVLDDVREILKVTGLTPRRLLLYTAPGWKVALHDHATGLARSGQLTMQALMAEAMKDVRVKAHAKEAPKAAQDLVKSLSILSKEDVAARAAPLDERDALLAAAPFLQRELGGTVEVHAADAEGIPDPAGKARHAAPRRPAIYVE